MLGEAEAQRAAHVDPTRQTLAEYLVRWLERKSDEGLSAKTLLEYRRVRRTFVGTQRESPPEMVFVAGYATVS
jgi:hypothetical protein